MAIAWVSSRAAHSHGGRATGQLCSGAARGQGKPDRRLARELKQQD